MRSFFAKPFRFAVIYTVVLTVFTGYVLLDTFLIPREMAPISYADLNSAEIPDNTSLSESSGDSSSENEKSNSSGSETLGQAVSSKTASEISETASVGADSSAAEPIDTSDYGFTENSYKDENISLTITTKRIYDTNAYIADIRLSDVSQLKTAFAQGKFGRNIVEKTSETAVDNNAIFAINGDYYGFREAGFVARNGALYRDTPRGAGDDALVIYGDGSFETVKESQSEATELFKNGAYHIFSFGPTLVENGEIVVGEKTEVKQCMVSNPRTAIGILEPLHYIIIVSDGRTEESAGLSLYQLGDVMKSLGCSIAYNLDGGGSATMWFNGRIVNVPTTDGSVHERRVSDIVYLG